MKNLVLFVTCMSAAVAVISFQLSVLVSIVASLLSVASAREFLILHEMDLLEKLKGGPQTSESNTLPMELEPHGKTLSADDWRNFALYVLASKKELQEKIEDVDVVEEPTKDTFAKVVRFDKSEKPELSDLQFIESTIDELQVPERSLIVTQMPAASNEETLVHFLRKSKNLTTMVCKNIYKSVDLIPHSGIVTWEDVDPMAQTFAQMRNQYDNIYFIFDKEFPIDPVYNMAEIVNGTRWIEDQKQESIYESQSLDNI